MVENVAYFIIITIFIVIITVTVTLIIIIIINHITNITKMILK